LKKNTIFPLGPTILASAVQQWGRTGPVDNVEIIINRYIHKVLYSHLTILQPFTTI
jgi:hypothetical protein